MPAPGPRPLLAQLEALRFGLGPLEYFVGLSRRYPVPLIHVRMGPGGSHYVVNAASTLREVLVEKPERFIRSPWIGPLRELVGRGLLTTDEVSWVGQRRRMNPAYPRDGAAAVTDATRAEAEATAARWRAADGVVDVQADLKRSLLRAVIGSLLGPTLPADPDQLLADLDVMHRRASVGDQVLRDMLRAVGLGGYGARALAEASGRLHAFIEGSHAACRAGTHAPGLVMEVLLAAEAQGAIDAGMVRDEIGTVLLAGFETTSAMLAFALFLLAPRPALWAAIADEAGAAATPTTDAVLHEALRLYPPVPFLSRKAAEAVTIGGVPIEAGHHVLICTYALHRDPARWDAPEAFRPERFADGGDGRQLAYLPFNHGRHTCIGKRMAMAQARIVLGVLATEVRLAPTGGRLRLDPGAILRARGGIPLRVHPAPRARPAPAAAAAGCPHSARVEPG